MSRHQRFTIQDLSAAVVVTVIALVIVNSIVGCDGRGSARRTARAMQDSTHLRGIHTGLVFFASGNKDYYPGVDSNGREAVADVSAKPHEYGFGTAKGRLTAYRMAVLLRANYFPQEYLISPAESNSLVKTPELGKNFADGEAYSYAMLNISDLDAPRAGEWRTTQSSSAAVISDRNIGHGADAATSQSNHTSKGDGWRGAVCYNDNHVQFETTNVIKTEYALKGEVAADNLFADSDIAIDNGKQTKNADAAMVFMAGDSYVNQNP